MEKEDAFYKFEEKNRDSSSQTEEDYMLSDLDNIEYHKIQGSLEV